MENIKKDFNEQYTEEDMMTLLLQFSLAQETEIEGIKNNILYDTCKDASKFLYKNCKLQSKDLIKTQKLNRILNNLGGILNNSDARMELDELLKQIIENMEFEKDKMSLMNKYLKKIKKIKEYDDLPLYYVTLLGMLKFHNDTMLHYQSKSEIIRNSINHIGYIPNKKYDLPSEDYKAVIDFAIERLYGKALPLFNNKSLCEINKKIYKK